MARTILLYALALAAAVAAAIEAKMVELRDMADPYRNPLFRIPITFVEVFPVGLIVALVSAALLRNPRILPART